MIKKNMLYISISIIITILILGGLKYYYTSEAYNLKCIISSVDGNRYCVRRQNKMQQSADLLATVTQECIKLVDYMKKTHPNDKRTKQLVKNFNSTKIQETLPTSVLTAYSENKGEKIAFCLNKTKNNKKEELIDIDTLTFVAFHELTHVMTESNGHKLDYWKNFKYLLENAKNANLYVPVDYKKTPANFCGMKINNNPYFDLI